MDFSNLNRIMKELEENMRKLGFKSEDLKYLREHAELEAAVLGQKHKASYPQLGVETPDGNLGTTRLSIEVPDMGMLVLGNQFIVAEYEVLQDKEVKKRLVHDFVIKNLRQ